MQKRVTLYGMTIEMPHKTLHDFLAEPEVYQTAKDITFLAFEYCERTFGALHIPTMIGTLSALLGERCLLAKHTPEDIAGAKYIKSDHVLNFFIGMDKDDISPLGIILHNGEIPLIYADALSFMQDIYEATTEAIDTDNTMPVLSVPDEYYPHEWSPDSTVNLRTPVNDLFNQIHADYQRQAQILAVAITNFFLMVPDLTEESYKLDILTQLAVEISYGCACFPPLQKTFGE